MLTKHGRHIEEQTRQMDATEGKYLYVLKLVISGFYLNLMSSKQPKRGTRDSSVVLLAELKAAFVHLFSHFIKCASRETKAAALCCHADALPSAASRVT